MDSLHAASQTLSPAVRFEAVTFGYSPGPDVLRAVDFEIHAGRMLGLTGHAGAGRRSCARLLLGEHRARSGMVRLDGADVADLPPGARVAHAQCDTPAPCEVLSRALRRDPAVLVVEEPQAYLSAADERAWRDAVDAARRGRTVLLIAHRLATLGLCDWIVVLEQGRVAEEGPHDRLVAWNDRYARLIATGVLRR